MTAPLLAGRTTASVDGAGRNLALLSFALGLHFVRYGIVFPLVPLFAQNCGASPSTIGIVVGAFSLFSIFLSVPAGGLVDVFGVRSMLLLGVLCNIANGVLLLTARGVPALLMAQVAGGLGFQLFVVTCQSHVSRMPLASDRERGFGYLTGAAALGQTLGPVLGGILAARLGYGAAFFVALLISVAGLVVVGVRAEPTAGPVPPYSLRRDLRQAGELLADHRMRAVLLFSSLAILAVSLRMSFLPVLLGARGLTETLIGLLVSVLAGVSMLVRPFMGFLFGLLSRKTLLATAAFTLVLGVTAVPLLSSAGSLAIALGIFGVGFGLTQPLSMVMVSDLAKAEHAGIAMGLRFSALTLANLLGPVALGFLVEGFGLGTAFYAPAALLGLVSAYILVLRPGLLPGRREENSVRP